MLTLSDDDVKNYTESGYLNAGPLLSDDEVDVLRDELERVIADGDDSTKPQPLLLRNLSGEDSAPVIQIVNIWMGSEPYRELMMRTELGEAAAALMSCEEVRVWHDQIQYKPKLTGGVNNWHQDWPLWPMLSGPGQASAWVALDDVDEENGCMSMVPGSHLWGNQIEYLSAIEDYNNMPDEFDGHEVKVVRRPVKKGEVHFHHALTWHGSHANNSDRPRRAIAIHYMNENSLYVKENHHPCNSLVKDVGDGEKLCGEFFPQVL
ncbi:MAG: phytanoyl-CoA dioxygenase family protein [Lentisphaeria bacterium]|nr:phytanoyl-CoA dioxygenase family protein [Lentisphaeria bacterium]NQZ69293.1 phytanoyl-CoA dioxygenase family protein [Lentisphaeria bacterium]